MANESTEKKDRRDLLLLLLIVLLAFVCMIITGGLAIQLAPRWMLDTNMDSGLNPDDFYTPQIGYIAPIEEGILTQRVDETYLTPGVGQPTTFPPVNGSPTSAPPRTRVASPTAVTTTMATVTTVATVTNVFTPRPTATLILPSSPTPVKPPTKTPKPPAPSADLSITKKDGKAHYTPGMDVIYTIRVFNAGPDDVTGATVSDTFPNKIASTHWTCAGTGGGTCTASGNHVINDTIDLPAGATVTYTVTSHVKSSATGNLRNTASVAVPAGVTDPDLSNNSNSDTDTPVYVSDLSINKDDGVNTYTPGGKLTYTIQVSNGGPSNVTGATVSDNFLAVTQIANTTWTCAASGGSCPASGTGNINHTINLSAGGTLTYTVIANINGGATGPLTNTAFVAVPAGVTDPDGSNNSSSDTDTRATSADLGITKAANKASYVPGDPMTYTIQVSNAGPHDVSGATVTDTFPASVTVNSWSCTATGVASCTAGGSGNINDTVDLPVGETVTYTVDVTVDFAASGNIVNTASVSPPAGVSDPNNANDSDTVTTPPEVCAIVGTQATIPDGGCIMNRPSQGVFGNLYDITNNDPADSLTIFWYGPPANQTSGTCVFLRQTTLVPGVLNQIAVAEVFGNNTILIFGNSSGHNINITIIETGLSSVICT